MLDLVRLLSVPSVDPDTGYDLSPDGAKLAFSWNQTGQWEIYELSLAPGAIPFRLTHQPGGKFAPRYSPDGTCLAYALDLDGGENYHLVLYSFSTGLHRDLTPGIAHALQPSFDWSPDGRQIALLSNRSGCFSTCILDVESGAERILLENGCPAMEVRWSPAGGWLAVCTETGGQDWGIFLVSLHGGEGFQLTDHGQPLNAHQPCWSPDGSRLAFSSDLSGEFRLGVVSLVDRQITWYSQDSGAVSHPDWSLDGQRLAAVHSQGAETCLTLIPADGSLTVTRRVGRGLHSQPRFTQDGQGLLCIFDSPCQPPDLWLLGLEDGTQHQLTHSLPDDLPVEQLVMPEEIHYPGLDGAQVPALLYCLPGLKAPAPAVVNIHGGPNWLYQFSWYPLMSHLASRGWVVLAPNYRGSTGYGRDWQLANRFDLGGVDTADVATGARFLINQGLAASLRIAVTGRSHGGYLTMTCLTQYPELWAGGSAVVPFLNWFTAHENSRSDLQHWDIENMGNPQDNQALWQARSPFFFLDQVRAPVQLICGAHDPRCPASESSAARDRLQALGREVDFHLYPDEGHVFLNTKNLIDAEQRRVDFLVRLLE
jgi:dipeptidyl aminopeptidase/acylaminoacyl peptidase